MIDYNDRKFKPVINSENGEVDSEMIFHYRQTGNIVTCRYSGSNITEGHLIALVDEQGVLNMRYHQINNKGEIMTGTCKSTPEVMHNGKIRLHENWQWTSGDMSKGLSLLEEL
ncbi:n-acetylglutamate synthase [Fulvivirga ulvae]|uniref:n-acetylglutamate synthase n=1 Tax=Fulvivirga ulvae TaxID=2904245 RepID=UPI001F183B2F|nr:n-acetylglutamate synthase [Fulvivirga ulvae]UII33458.1 n-acetylglutamate synthase [Fulvivirga ulvae]